MRNALKGAEGVRALVSPSSIAIVGASDRRGSWSKRVYDALTRTGFSGPIYPVNPRNETVWDGVKCHPSLSALPEPADHVVILVPGMAVVDTIKEAGQSGSRSATIFSSGFGEGGDAEGGELGTALRAAIAESGLAVSGPNCLGNLAARFNLMTLTDTRIENIARGPIAIFGQSGGIVTAIYRSLAGRGMQPGYALTVGNEVNLNSADYIRYFADDDDTKIIVGYIEAIKDPVGFKVACRAARDAGKPVVLIKVGGSEASREAALAHTGSLAGSLDCFDAVAETIGVTRVNTLDEMVELVELFTHGPQPAGSRVGAITLSGGFKALLLEASERNGAPLPTLSDATLAKLGELVGVGTSLGNPLDAGFTGLSDRNAYLKCIEIIQADPAVDIVVVQEELPSAEGLNAKAENLRQIDELVAQPGSKPVAVVSMASYMYTDHSRAFRSGIARLPVLHEVDMAMKSIAAAGRWQAKCTAAAAEGQKEEAIAPIDLGPILDRSTALGERRVLSEADSKTLVQAYGVPVPEEGFAESAAAAVAVAEGIGYPVVLKLVSPDIQHKTEVGGVIVGLDNARAVEDGFEQIRSSLARARADAKFEGVLISKRVEQGVELVIGIQMDPEIGPVVMFGSGGILLELHKDVAFGAVPLSRAQAEDMIGRTKAGELLDGFRGSLPCDRGAVVDALVGLSRLAEDLGAQLESIDINPLVALPGQKGLVALDALVILASEVS